MISHDLVSVNNKTRIGRFKGVCSLRIGSAHSSMTREAPKFRPQLQDVLTGVTKKREAGLLEARGANEGCTR